VIYFFATLKIGIIQRFHTMKTFFSLKAQFQLLERGRTVAGFVMNVENNAIFVQEKKIR